MNTPENITIEKDSRFGNYNVYVDGECAGECLAPYEVGDFVNYIINTPDWREV